MRSRRFLRMTFCLSTLLIAVPFSLQAQNLSSISPSNQRVEEFIELKGFGFGNGFPGGSAGVFFRSSAGVVLKADTPQIWSDRLIRVRVPAALSSQSGNAFSCSVRLANGASSRSLLFHVIRTCCGPLPAFVERNLLGGVDQNCIQQARNNGQLDLQCGMKMARTKDAHFADIDSNGFPDLIDFNSGSRRNTTHSAVHRFSLEFPSSNIRTQTRPLEPLDSSFAEQGIGAVATSVSDFVRDAVIYDGDLVDLNADGKPDIVMAASLPLSETASQRNRLRILINTSFSGFHRFAEQSQQWLPSINTVGGCPFEIDSSDFDNDGDMDLVVAVDTGAIGTTNCPNASGSDTLVVYHNCRFPNGDPGCSVQGPNSLIRGVVPIGGPRNALLHDVATIDIDQNGFMDAIACGAGDKSRLVYSDLTQVPVPNTGGFGCLSSATADLNGDGLTDFVLGGATGRVYLNNGLALPFPFDHVASFPCGTSSFEHCFDLELGDIDLDGDVDIVAAVASAGSNRGDLQIFLNIGVGFFTQVNTSALLPNLQFDVDGDGRVDRIERMSAQLIDFDLDGDLDLYVAGANGQDVDQIAQRGIPSSSRKFGRIPNQLWENCKARSFRPNSGCR